MSHTYKFIHVSGNDCEVIQDISDISEIKRGSVVRLEYGSDGKLLNSAVTKQNGIFEPTFTLRAGDIMAAAFVKLYYEMLKVANANQEKVVSCLASAKTFEDYEGPKKVAD